MSADVIDFMRKTTPTEMAAANGDALALECLIELHHGETPEAVAKKFAEHLLDGICGEPRDVSIAYLAAFIEGSAGQHITKIE